MRRQQPVRRESRNRIQEEVLWQEGDGNLPNCNILVYFYKVCSF